MKSVSAGRIDAGAHRPEHVVHIVDIDVVIDHDDVAAEVRAGLALRGDHRRLLGVAGIALLDRDRGEESALIVTDAAHVRHPGFVEMIPNVRGAEQASRRRRAAAKTARR